MTRDAPPPQAVHALDGAWSLCGLLPDTAPPDRFARTLDEVTCGGCQRALTRRLRLAKRRSAQGRGGTA